MEQTYTVGPGCVLLGDRTGRAARVTRYQDEVRVRFECRDGGGREDVMEVTPPPDLRERLDDLLTEIQQRAFPSVLPLTF